MMQGPVPTQSSPQRFFHMPRFQHTYQKNFNVYQYKQHMQQNQNVEFDGKRLRKAVNRKTIDYNSSVIKYLETRVWRRDFRDQRAIQPDTSYYTELFPCMGFADNPINAVTTKFVRTSTSKMRCPIFCLCWTPEGRRLVTGASSGEFTLWNGLTFNFETILQAHDSPVRSMIWSHNDTWMITGDHAGFVKYWQSNMNNVKMFQAHQEPLRGLSFCPTDTKFATCSDDGTVRIWDFLRCYEEKILRGHGSDVKCVDWHPQKSLIVSGSKDSQQPIKLWDPKSGQSLATLHAHKSTVMEIRWNQNGNWLLTASRDHLLKLFDIRNMKELQTFRGHKKEATSIAWHPVHESLFASGGSDGAIMFWLVGADKEVGGMEQAHESIVWSLAWHPLGHILCSGSNDHTSKFWTRNRPGDRMRDKYNLNTLPVGSSEEMLEYDDISTAPTIPGMGLEHGLPDQLRSVMGHNDDQFEAAIPGLDWEDELDDKNKLKPQKKVPYSKPIPHQFQQQWAENKQPLLLAPPKGDSSTTSQQQQPPPPPSQQQPPQGMHPSPNLNMPPPNMPPPNMSHPPFMPRPRMPSPIHQEQNMGGPRGPRPLHSNMTFRPPRPTMNQMPRNMRPMNPGQGVNKFHMAGTQNQRMPSPGDSGHFRDEGMSTSPPNINKLNRSNEEPSQNFHQSNTRNMFRNNFEEQPQTDFSNPFGDSDFRNRNAPPSQDNQSPDHRQDIRGPPPRWEESQRTMSDYDDRLSISSNDNYIDFEDQENQKFGKEFRGRGRGSPRGRGRGRDFNENSERFSRQGLDEQGIPSSENVNSIKRTWEEGPGNRGPPPPQSWEEEQEDSQHSRGPAQQQWGENSNEVNNQRGQFRPSNDWNENYGHMENQEDTNHSASHRGTSSEFRGGHQNFGKQNTTHGGPGNSTRNQGQQGFNEEFSEQNNRQGSSNRGRGEGHGGWAPRRGRSRGRGGGRGTRGQ